MDFKRLSLYAALAIISYMLLLQWNQDYPNAGNQSSLDTALAPGGNELPAITGNNDELPQVNPASAQAGAVDSSTNVALVEVITPIHRLSISLEGGDIIKASLPDYPQAIDTPDQAFVMMHRDSSGTYIAQSALLGINGADNDGRAVYSTDRSSYTLTDPAGSLTVPLYYTDAQGNSFTKTFHFDGDDYLIGVEYSINNAGSTPLQVNMVGQIRRDGAEDPSKRGGIGGVSTFLGGVLTTDEDAYKKVDFDEMEKGTVDVVEGGWIGFSQHYFLSAWVPAQDQNHDYQTRQIASGDYMMSFANKQATIVPANGSASVGAGIWIGPKDQNRLEQIAENLNLTIDYGMLFMVAKPIFILLTTLDEYIGNFGWSIIAMTLVIKLVLMYFSTMSYRSMARMRKLTPHVNALKERYGDDKQKLMQAQMELWRKEKVNPMGGCLPMFLQMPVLIGIYWVLNESVELRHAPWIGWYNDLSAMDPYFILPLIMGASMYVSQLMTPMTTMDPMQAKMLKWMPAFFTIFFLWFPSGLVLYWLVSNVFNICHQSYINKRVEKTFNPKHV